MSDYSSGVDFVLFLNNVLCYHKIEIGVFSFIGRFREEFFHMTTFQIRTEAITYNTLAFGDLSSTYSNM